MRVKILLLLELLKAVQQGKLLLEAHYGQLTAAPRDAKARQALISIEDLLLMD